MQFLADENFPLASIQLLIEKGYFVKQAAILFQGKPDIFLLEQASTDNLFILTFDKDFGELIFKSQLTGVTGVVLFRLQNYMPVAPAEILLTLLNTKDIDLKNNLTVIDENKIRQRPIK